MIPDASSHMQFGACCASFGIVGAAAAIKMRHTYDRDQVHQMLLFASTLTSPRVQQEFLQAGNNYPKLLPNHNKNEKPPCSPALAMNTFKFQATIAPARSYVAYRITVVSCTLPIPLGRVRLTLFTA